MRLIPRRHLTLLESIAAFVSVGVLIGFFALGVPEHLGVPETTAGGILITAVDGALTFLVMAVLMPTWGVNCLGLFRLWKEAEQFAQWGARFHPLREQRIECGIYEASLAQSRGRLGEAAHYAVQVLTITQNSIDKPDHSLYYALCLSIRASFLLSEARYQEALEDYACATRLNLQPASLTAQYYARGSGVLYFLERFEDALLFADQAIAGSSDKPDVFTAEAHRWAALSLAELTRYDEAVIHSQTGLLIRPFNLTSAWLLADHPWLLFMAGRHEEAETRFAALKQTATVGVVAELLSQEYYETLGRVRLAQGKLEEAETLFSASFTEAAGLHTSGLYHLALLAQHRGATEAAEAYRERLLQEAPECFYAKRLREQIPSLNSVV